MSKIEEWVTSVPPPLHIYAATVNNKNVPWQICAAIFTTTITTTIIATTITTTAKYRYNITTTKSILPIWLLLPIAADLQLVQQKQTVVLLEILDRLWPIMVDKFRFLRGKKCLFRVKRRLNNKVKNWTNII